MRNCIGKYYFHARISPTLSHANLLNFLVWISPTLLHADLDTSLDQSINGKHIFIGQPKVNAKLIESQHRIILVNEKLTQSQREKATKISVTGELLDQRGSEHFHVGNIILPCGELYKSTRGSPTYPYIRCRANFDRY